MKRKAWQEFFGPLSPGRPDEWKILLGFALGALLLYWLMN